MKHILTTLLLCVSSLCFSQDTLQIPALELEEFFLALDTLETQDSIKTVLITELEKQIAFHKELNDHNDLLLRYRDEEIELLNEQINLHLDYINSIDKWYKKPWVGVVGGFVGTIVLINTIDYTLPD
tara:strand:- start:187 stop:567 length:381 start_codon:yes stop_codon:yes gene_type:complete